MSGIAYVHKPVAVQAMQVPPQWQGQGIPTALIDLANWLGINEKWKLCGNGQIEIGEGFDTIVVQPGDWIIKDATGGFHFCDDNAFQQNYEKLK